jgi:hypothetical protein
MLCRLYKYKVCLYELQYWLSPGQLVYHICSEPNDLLDIGQLWFYSFFYIEVQKLKETKCYKCKRNCKTRAALCLKGHWVHYICDKLTDQEITSIENKLQLVR